MNSRTNQAWFMKYKPRTVDDIIFPSVLNEQQVDPNYIKELFSKYIQQGYVPGNILSYGPGGFGKTSLMDVIKLAFLKHPDDLKKLGHSVNDVRDLKAWLQYSSKGSSQRIVEIEEADRLTTEAQTELKNGLMEKYQGKVLFIANTNHPEKLDKALKTRFNHRLNFKALSPDQAFDLIKKILIAEKIEFIEDEVKQFIYNNINMGLRDLINAFEIASASGKLQNLNNTASTKNNEEYIIQVTDYLLKIAETYDMNILEKILQSTSNHPDFNKYYQAMVKVTQDDPFLEYDYIYKQLLDKDLPLDVIATISKEYQEINNKIFLNHHFLATFIKALMAIYRRKSGKTQFILV